MSPSAESSAAPGAGADVPAADAAHKTPARRLCSALLRGAAALLMLCVGLGYAAAAFGLLWQPGMPDESRTAALISAADMLLWTFRFHLGIAVLPVAAMLLALRRRRWSVAAILLSAFAAGPGLVSYLPTRAADTAEADTALQIMSFNVYGRGARPQPMLQEILAADPDVLLLQEYTPRFHQAAWSALRARFPYRHVIPRHASWGMALYSKRPFIERPRDDVQLGNLPLPNIRAVIDVEGRPLAIYNIHLITPLGRWHTAEQQRQFVDLAQLIARESDPVIVGGDFNTATPAKYWRVLARYGLRHAHGAAGYGRGATFPASGWRQHLPGIRIDHILVDDALRVHASRVGDGGPSDHRPVHATVTWK